ncbi:MAG: ABC transporter permease [Anaerolineae bacterium]|nr:ABC transporter permease [Anaerolineae bacterium]
MTSQTAKIELDKQTEVRLGGSLWRQAFRHFIRNRSAIAGMILIGFVVFMAGAAPLIAPYDPNLSMIGLPGHEGRLAGQAPCIHALGCPPEMAQHLMGLDLNGRDMFSRVVFGSRVSLVVGFASVFLSIIVGSLLGLVSGYSSFWTDNVIMRSMDVLLAFPSLILAIAIVTVLGPGLQNALIAIAIVNIPVYARLARAQVLSLREMDYVLAAQSLGDGNNRILFMHIMPNALTPLIVQGTLGIAGAVLEAAALSFIGLGAQPPTPEWGAILSEGRNYIFTSPHLVFFPGIAIMITVLGFNLVGDGLRDSLDPRLNKT